MTRVSLAPSDNCFVAHGAEQTHQERLRCLRPVDFQPDDASSGVQDTGQRWVG